MVYLDNEIRKEVAKLHYKAGAFQANTIEPFHVGRNRSPIYVKSQEFLNEVTLKNTLMNHLEKVAQEIYFDIIAGIETGGSLFSSKLAQRLNRPEIYIRKKTIKYTLSIEGIKKKELKGKKILLFDDTIYSGKTIENAINLLTDSGAIVKDCMVFFDRQQHKKELFNDINLYDLTNTTIMQAFLIDSGITLVNNISLNEINLYVKDPEKWHKNQGFTYHKE